MLLTHCKITRLKPYLDIIHICGIDCVMWNAESWWTFFHNKKGATQDTTLRYSRFLNTLPGQDMPNMHMECSFGYVTLYGIQHIAMNNNVWQISKDAVVPCGVICFFYVEKYTKAVLFLDKRIADVCLKAYQMVRSRPALSDTILIRIKQFIGF